MIEINHPKINRAYKYPMLFLITSLFQWTLQAQLSKPHDFKYGLIVNACTYDTNFTFDGSPSSSLIPKEGFILYDRPDGNPVGSLTEKPDPESRSEYRTSYVIQDTRGVFQYRSKPSVQRLGYEYNLLEYKDRQDGYVKIVDQNSTYWIPIEQINTTGYCVKTWIEYFKEHDNMQLFATGQGLSLRDAPSPKANRIMAFTGEDFLIQLIQETAEELNHPSRNNSYTKVKIIKRKAYDPYSQKNDTPENIEYEKIGWIKIVDDNGAPNILYTTIL